MDVRVPRLAEGVESATVANVLVAPGDRIEKDQVILELETEKAVGPIPSPIAGEVARIHVKAGDEVSVGQPLITLNEAAGAAKAAPAEKPAPPAETKAPRAAPAAAAPRAAAPPPASAYRYESASGAPPPAAPSVRKIAGELGIDLARVKGSERGGRITIADLRSYIAALQQRPADGAAPAAAVPTEKPAAQAIDFSRWGPVEKKPLTSVRRTIGQRMHESWSAIPHVTQFEDVDITNITNLRKQYGPELAKRGKHLTLTPFVLKAVVAALKKYPIFNSSLDEATGEVVYKKYFHIGVAVDTEAGLIVPVLRDVDKKSLGDLSQELNDLVERTRKRKISLDELQGGSFTISNQGGIGGGHFTPIINKPEVAILGIGRSTLKPLVKDGKIEARPVLPLALSYDHRVMDGADAVRFVTELVGTLESFPEALLKN
jgi:pyruvate dehydrogenase E2 component (dihydrolipoamide acetyltransferase)